MNAKKIIGSNAATTAEAIVKMFMIQTSATLSGGHDSPRIASGSRTANIVLSQAMNRRILLCDAASTEEFRRFARTFQKSPLADWRRRPRVQQPDSERPDFPAEASSAADARVGRASFELHFGQPAAALREKVALHRCWRLEPDPLPVRACSNGILVSKWAEAESS